MGSLFYLVIYMVWPTLGSENFRSSEALRLGGTKFIKKPIFISLHFTSPFLKPFTLSQSTISWSSLFHRSATRHLCLSIFQECLRVFCQLQTIHGMIEMARRSFFILNTSRRSARSVARPGILKWVGSAKGVSVQKQGVWGRKSPSGVQGQSPGKGSGGLPPEAERFL